MQKTPRPKAPPPVMKAATAAWERELFRGADCKVCRNLQGCTFLGWPFW